MKNTFGGLVKTRKLWESGWAIRESKKQNKTTTTKKEPWENPDGKTIVNISKKKENNQTKSEKKKKKKKEKKYSGKTGKQILEGSESAVLKSRGNLQFQLCIHLIYNVNVHRL